MNKINIDDFISGVILLGMGELAKPIVSLYKEGYRVTTEKSYNRTLIIVTHNGNEIANVSIRESACPLVTPFLKYLNAMGVRYENA